MIGRIVSHYRIIEKLGAGGMGVVYRADDLKLMRPVALKFLPDGPGHQDRHAIERFQREARAASALNNPHICTIYDIDEYQGIHFIAMELLEGENLQQRLLGPPLKIDEILDFSMQVVEGLVAAHTEGIIHRDIKPANVFLTRQGTVKLLDFGLAKLLPGRGLASEAATGETLSIASMNQSLTSTGTAIGTVAYMSPEQALGKAVDARGDIFSLGIMLYEMTTGVLPFQGETTAALFDQLLHKEVSTSLPSNRDIPEDLGRIICKALEKDSTLRYQNATDLQADLRRVKRDRESGHSTPPATGHSPHIRSLAVLPFTDMSPGRDQEAFCSGLAEELITSLARIKDLRVAARTSAFSFKSKNADVREIGSKLGVEALVEGSVRKSGNTLRIAVQLISVADGYHLWTERYDREIKDVFAIQDEVTVAIIDHLKLTLVPEERLGIFRRKTDDLEAHNLYLTGLNHLWTNSSSGFMVAARVFEQAIERDPGYAQAYWGLSSAYLQIAFWGNVPSSDASRKVKLYARRALAIDPSMGDAHGVLSYVYLIHDWNWKAAEREALEAIRLSPSSPAAHAYYSWFLLASGRFNEGLAEALKAQSLDPVSGITAFVVGFAFAVSRDFPRAIDEFRAGIQQNPDFYILYSWLGQTCYANRQYAEAILAHEKAVEISQRLPYFVGSLATTYYHCGRAAEADMLWQELEERAKHEYVPPICFMQMNAVRGRLGPLLQSLRKAAEVRDTRLCWIKVIPKEYIQSPADSRFKAAFRKALLNAVISRIIARRRIIESDL